ncbi:MAG TPA: PilZ domain-containing protein [Gammaproteobacteria bacterium]|nr:PilZ domain-containing protein [Gammaproteobacteria bacterium]
MAGSDGSFHAKCTADIKVMHESIGAVVMKMQDLTDRGIYILCEDVPMPSVGSIVQVQIQGMAEEAPIVDMEVITIEPDRIGLRFVNP